MQSISGIQDVKYHLLSYLDPITVEQVALVNKEWMTTTQSPDFCKYYVSSLSLDKVKDISIFSFKFYLPFLSINQLWNLNKYKLTPVILKIPEDKENKVNLLAAKLITSLWELHVIYARKLKKDSEIFEFLNNISEHQTESQKVVKSDTVPKTQFIKLNKSSQNKERSLKNNISKVWRDLETSNKETLEYILKMEFKDCKLLSGHGDGMGISCNSNILFKAYCQFLEESRHPGLPIWIKTDEQLDILENTIKSSRDLELKFTENLDPEKVGKYLEKLCSPRQTFTISIRDSAVPETGEGNQ